MLTMEQKRKIVNDLDKRVNELEVKCASELRRFFLGLEKELVANLSETTLTHELRSIIDSKWDEYIQIMYKYSLEAHMAGELLYNYMSNQKPVVKAKPIIPFTVEWDVRTRTTIASEYVRKRYGDKVIETVNNGYQEGIGIVEIRKNLQKLNNNFKNYEAHRIARTEIQSHRNQATFEQMQTEGTEYKQWLTMTDELVRGNRPSDSADHVSLEGEIQPVNEPFSNGLMYPGDKNGDISEWINCRCTSVPYVMLPNEFPQPDGGIIPREEFESNLPQDEFGEYLDKNLKGFIDEEDHKAVVNSLYEFANDTQYKGINQEFARYYDLNGNPLSEMIVGEKGSVEIPTEVMNKAQGCIDIHNHPNGNIAFGSTADFQHWWAEDIKYGIVSTQEDGFFVYKKTTDDIDIMGLKKLEQLAENQKTIQSSCYKDWYYSEANDVSERIARGEIERTLEARIQASHDSHFKYWNENMDKYVDKFNSLNKQHDIPVTITHIPYK